MLFFGSLSSKIDLGLGIIDSRFLGSKIEDSIMIGSKKFLNVNSELRESGVEANFCWSDRPH